MTTWVSHAAVAEIVGCSSSMIEAHLDEIAHSPRYGGRAILDFESVEAFATRWRTPMAEEEARRRAEVIPPDRPRN